MINWIKNLFSPVRKDGKCKWWHHEYDNGERVEFMRDTGQFIDGKPIQRKYYYNKYTCTNPGCKNRWFSDTFPM